MTAAVRNGIWENHMASKGFEPDVKVRAKDYRIGCVGTRP